ncbi:DUF4159 domain-containing protein [Pedobacter sp. AJM]|uniref:DUF4159 domain-containing protein n=1 Tax=Pedobacter sp. AJM TaxID=2003629 RepID=UPI000B4BF275|nr:DUF4159 domain-containing protein [Pedobacter sp. AJM]OWK72563.1 hypothetical protein CBW18_03135 [Pedobacter sp. AJM]
MKKVISDKLKVKGQHSFFLKRLFFFSFLLIPFSLLFCLLSFTVPSYRMGKLKYSGGGDWYADRTALPNLISFCNTNLKTNFYPEESIVEVGSKDIFNFPFVYMTGHGNVQFSDLEVKNLRQYLTGGGFLHIDDNYGLDKFIRPQMKKVFPELDFVELPSNHAIYQQKFKFPGGLPKIHEHDNKRPQGFALIYKGRVVCYYTYECDLGNGWEDLGTYAGDTQETRLKALKMGANLVQYALTQ